MNDTLQLFQARALPLFTEQRYLVSFAVLAALLFLAQAFNWLRLKSANPSDTHRKVAVIIGSWWKILLFSFFAFWGGSLTLLPAFFFLTLFAVHEFLGVSALKEARNQLYPVAAAGVLLHYVSFPLDSPDLFYASSHLYILFLVMPLMILSKQLDKLHQLIAAMLGIMVLTVFLSFPVAIVHFPLPRIEGESQARLAVLLLIVLTQVNDILQFLNGKLFGRRKIIPWISPNKTEAGFIGGIFFSTLLGTFLWPLLLEISLPMAAGLSFLLSVGGMLGDLVCSAIKRHLGVKDFSDIIPGHGGVIDRMDSLLVTAPIFYYFLQLLQG
ncbi:MAG: CDP-archaeol synthase [Proteobacteria bacterium]|nr:MAG: CDP-archaeol synthase [Pseudomonadota bacterium]